MGQQSYSALAPGRDLARTVQSPLMCPRLQPMPSWIAGRCSWTVCLVLRMVVRIELVFMRAEDIPVYKCFRKPCITASRGLFPVLSGCADVHLNSGSYASHGTPIDVHAEQLGYCMSHFTCLVRHEMHTPSAWFLRRFCDGGITSGQSGNPK